MKTGWKNITIVTVDSNNTILNDAGLLFENGIITDIGSSEQIEHLAASCGAELKDGHGQYLFPGLVNTHTHLYQEIMKGMGSDLSLEDWFPKSMAPAGAVLTADHVAAGVRLGLIEAIRCGVTTVADYMQLQPVRGLGKLELDIAKETGIRMVYGRGYRDIGKPELIEDANAVFEDVASLKEEFEGNGLYQISLAPAAGWGASAELLKATRAFADKSHTPIMMHMFETETDNNVSLSRHQKPAIDFYEETGLLGPDLLAVHSVAIGDKEISKYREYGAAVSYNPVANMYLASGVAPIRKMLEAGIRVGIGTDGAGSNNDNDMLEAMKSGALLQKAFAKDPQALTAPMMLRMASIDGAAALGLSDKIGSIECGKRADFFLYDPSKSAKACPVHDITASLIYSGDHTAVRTVVVNGQTLMTDGKLLTICEEDVLKDAQTAAMDLAARMRQHTA